MMGKTDQHVGKVLVYTGNGKGKTTAAFGLAARALGRDMKVLILQFIKSPKLTYGEQISLEKLGAKVEQLGIGFTWLKTPEEHRVSLEAAWKKAKEELLSGQYDVVIFDELNNALAIDSFPIDDVLPLTDIVETIKNKPVQTHLIITGRDAKPEIKELADLVSVINEEKHYYQDGVDAIYGIEY